MKRKIHHHILLFFFLFQLVTNAQTLESLEKDPDITWIGIVETNYAFDIDWYDHDGQKRLKRLGIDSRNSYKWLKFLAKNQNEDFDIYECLEHKIIKEAGALKRYKDVDLKEELTQEEYEKGFVGYTDTTEHGDELNTYWEITEERATPEVLNHYIVSFRLKQLFYYNQKKLLFVTVPLAVAPVLLFEKDTIEIWKTPFWLKTLVQETVFDLDDKNITWAKRTYREIPFDKIKVLKGETEKVKAHFFQQVLTQRNNLKIRSTHEKDGGDLLRPEALESLIVHSDTALVEPDDWSNPVLIDVIRDTLDVENIKDIRIAQDWGWDFKEQQIKIRFVHFSPIVSRFDDNGNFLSKGPLFHRRKNEE